MANEDPQPDGPMVSEAKEDIALAGMLGGDPKPPPSTPQRDHTTISDDELEEVGKQARGCLPDSMSTLLPIIVTILIVIGAVGFLASKDDKDDSAASSNCRAPSGGAVGDLEIELELISYQQPCPDDDADDGSDGATSDGDASDDAASDDDASDDDAEGGASGGAISDDARPPAEEDLPEGAILFQGSSASPIGCIACDGASRFLSVEADGVVVGNPNATSVATTWEQDGQILEFGARLSAPNLGRYGVNLFYADTFEYAPGVALETGEQSAVYQWTPERDGTVLAGRPVVIIVGEQGHVEANGAYTLDWWFVFQPD